uniref:Transmembrane protein n=1 Tax=Strongyloides stercoralis TaxID=6248 RepID=A0A0K0EKC7_STRER
MCGSSLIGCGYVLLMVCGVALAALALFYPAGVIIGKTSPLVDECINKNVNCDKLKKVLDADVLPFSCSFATLFNLIQSKDLEHVKNDCTKDYMDKIDKKVKITWISSATGIAISGIGVIAGIITIVLFSCCGCLRSIPMILLTAIGLALTACMIAFVTCYHDKMDYFDGELRNLFPNFDPSSMLRNTLWFGIGGVLAGGASAILAFLGIFSSLTCCC